MKKTTTDDEWGVVSVEGSGHRQRPCSECPWRTDVPVGKFPPEVFAHSRHTSVQPTEWTGQQHRFGCHMTAPSTGSSSALDCAGFLAIAGAQNWDVRISVFNGAISADMLAPKDDWPPLYDSYDHMARANGYDHEQDDDVT